MKKNNLRPEDFIRNFSPGQKAELYLHIADERPKIEKFIFGPTLNKITHKLLASYIMKRRDKKITWLLKAVDKKTGKNYMSKIINLLEDTFSSDHLRKFEYSFLAHYLMHKDVSKNIIVDMGGGFSYSTIVPILLRLPATKTISIDVMNYSAQSKFNIEYVRGDCMHTNLPSESADVVSLISTLEHVGLGRYGDPLDVAGDIHTMEEAWRILKPGGHVILTIPYGYPTVVFNLHRVYDRGRFSLLTRYFRPIVVKYSLLGRLATRKEVEGKKVAKIIPGYYIDVSDYLRYPDPQGGLLALLKKM